MGSYVKEITSEYSMDENGDLKLTKQKVNEKNLPPNPDIIKLIFHSTDADDYEKLTDEQLLQERERLLNELKEKNDSRKTKTKN